MSPAPVYKRVLLKLSGEMLAGEQKFGIQPDVILRLSEEIQEIHELGVELAVVLGGGNIFRGIAGASEGMDRAHADHMGMLATVINALAMQDCLERMGCYTRVMTALEMPRVAEAYIRRRAIRHMEKGRVVIFGAGTGNPYFSTDTGAALRAAEIHADIILKGTKVDGVYDRDPLKDPEAVRYEQLDYRRVLQEDLKVMDATATSLCKDNSIPIIVFNLNVPGNIRRVICGEKVGTLVSNAPVPSRAAVTH